MFSLFKHQTSTVWKKIQNLGSGEDCWRDQYEQYTDFYTSRLWIHWGRAYEFWFVPSYSEYLKTGIAREEIAYYDKKWWFYYAETFLSSSWWGGAWSYVWIIEIGRYLRSRFSKTVLLNTFPPTATFPPTLTFFKWLKRAEMICQVVSMLD